jgi:transcription elongation factor GreA
MAEKKTPSHTSLQKEKGKKETVKKAPAKKAVCAKKTEEAPKKKSCRSSQSAKSGKSTSVFSENDVLITEKGLADLKKELVHLETDKRKAVAARLKEALSYGDLKENSEYQEAKEEQAIIESRIIELTKKIKNAKIISEEKHGRINVGSKIELLNITRDEKESYTIVGSIEVNPFKNTISHESPLGGVLIGKEEGECFKVQAPGGEFEYKILKIL